MAALAVLPVLAAPALVVGAAQVVVGACAAALCAVCQTCCRLSASSSGEIFRACLCTTHCRVWGRGMLVQTGLCPLHLWSDSGRARSGRCDRWRPSSLHPMSYSMWGPSSGSASCTAPPSASACWRQKVPHIVAAALKQRKCHCQSCESVQNTLQGHHRDETAHRIHIAALVFSADQSLAHELDIVKTSVRG